MRKKDAPDRHSLEEPILPLVPIILVLRLVDTFLAPRAQHIIQNVDSTILRGIVQVPHVQAMSLDFDVVLLGSGQFALKLLDMDWQPLTGQAAEVIVPFEAQIVVLVVLDYKVAFVVVIPVDAVIPLGEDETVGDGVECEQLAKGRLAEWREEVHLKVLRELAPGGVGRCEERSRREALCPMKVQRTWYDGR